MSQDVKIREFERAVAIGEPADGLVRALERKGDHEALCSMGFHDVDDSEPPRRQCVDPECGVLHEEGGDAPCSPDTWVLFCEACLSAVHVYWVGETRLYYGKGGDAANLAIGPAAQILVRMPLDPIVGEWGRLLVGHRRVFYCLTAQNGSKWDVSWFRVPSLLEADMVAKAEAVSPGEEVTASARNGSGVTISFVVGSAPSHMGGCTFWQQILEVNG